MNKIFLHIGTHKTGSTSLQDFLVDHAEKLKDRNLAFYEGMKEPGNHLELHVSAMRQDRMSFSKEKYGITGDQQYINEVKNHVAAFQRRHPNKDLIFSTEALNLLRFDDEIETLKEVLNLDSYETIIVIVLRERDKFLKSYRIQIQKAKNRQLSNDPTSHLYTEADSWIADYDNIRQVWSSHFGIENYVEIKYGDAMNSNNDVLPTVLSALGLPNELIRGTEKYRSNKNGVMQRIRRLIARALNR